MKKLSLFMFIVSAGIMVPFSASFSLEIPTDLDRLKNKHIYFVPQQEKYVFSDEKALFKKHKGKTYLITAVEKGPTGIPVLFVINENQKKPKTIQIPAKKDGKNYIIKGAEIPEKLEEAKAFFKGKTLYKNPLIKDAAFSRVGNFKIKIYKGQYGTERYVPNDAAYTIQGVEWSDTYIYPYKLIISDTEYTLTSEPDRRPYGFVFDLNAAAPEDYKVYKTNDEPEKSSFSKSTNTLKTPSNYKMDFDFLVYKKDKKSLGLTIVYTAEDWLFADEALIFIDGRKIPLKQASRPSRDVLHGGIISETLSAELSDNLAKKIINAKKVSVRISGDKGYKDGEFVAQNFYNLKRFYEEEIKK